MSWPSAGLNGHVVNVATAFEEAQIVKIILAIDFSHAKNLYERHHHVNVVIQM